MNDLPRLVPSSLRSAGRVAMNRMGIEVARHPYINRLVDRLHAENVSHAVDVGANEGQWARKLFEGRYRGSVTSVEPLSDAYSRLALASASNPNWDVVRTAVSDHPGQLTINVAGNSQSSSVLPMLDLHVQAAPTSKYTREETVPATTIDLLLSKLRIDPARCFVKIDVQGYEAAVLAGAAEALQTLAMVELELSLAPLYEAQALMPELVDTMAGYGLELWSLRPAFAEERTGRLLQLDGVFARFDTTASA